MLFRSDGLSGVVTEQTLYQTLSSVRDPDKAALQLVELAIRGGGPDNITCIVADVLDTQVSAVPPTWTPVFAGAAATGAPTDPRQPARQSSPATRAMRLTRTTPQPAARDEQTTGVWPSAGRREGYTGQFDTAPFEADGFGTGPGTGRFERAGFDGVPGEDEDDYDGRGGRRRGTRGSRHRYDVDGDGDGGADDDVYSHRGRRRWPIVTGALVLLVILLGGGAYGAWWYNQQQYYVGIHAGYVAIFRGTNQSVAGISLSSLLTPSTLKVSQLGTNDQGTISQTISKGSVADAEALITQLQSGVDQCHGQWTALTAWQTQSVKYQADKAAAARSKAKVKPKVPASDNPGPMPAVPDTASCAPAAAFGIPASALPAQAGGSAASATPSTTPTPTPTPHPSVTPTASAKKSATPRATK